MLSKILCSHIKSHHKHILKLGSYVHQIFNYVLLIYSKNLNLISILKINLIITDFIFILISTLKKQFDSYNIK